MDNYFNMERVKQAHGLCETIRQYNLTIREYNLHREAGEPKKPELGSTELTLLMILARKFGQIVEIEGKKVAIGIVNGCRASLEILERESRLERKAIGNSLGKLIDAGFITQTYDRDLRTELTKEGKRRLERGLSLDNAAKNNYMRQPMGAPRKDGSDNGRWKHCVYHLVPQVWDNVVFETRGEREPVAAVSVSAEVQRAANSIDELPVTKKQTTVTDEQAYMVFGDVQIFFEGHPTLTEKSEEDARKCTKDACVDLARRAIALGALSNSYRFMVWLKHQRESEWLRLMNKVTALGGPYGLRKTIKDLWEQFIPEKDEIDVESASDESESADDQDNSYDSYDAEDAFTQAASAPAARTKTAAPIFEFNDEDDAEPEEPVKSFIYERQAFIGELRTKTDLLRRPSEAFTINLDPEKDIRLGSVSKWLDAVPYGRQIVHERMGHSSKSILRVEIKWNVARYIVEHVEQFVEDGYVDETTHGPCPAFPFCVCTQVLVEVVPPSTKFVCE